MMLMNHENWFSSLHNLKHSNTYLLMAMVLYGQPIKNKNVDVVIKKILIYCIVFFFKKEERT